MLTDKFFCKSKSNEELRVIYRIVCICYMKNYMYSNTEITEHTFKLFTIDKRRV